MGFAGLSCLIVELQRFNERRPYSKDQGGELLGKTPGIELWPPSAQGHGIKQTASLQAPPGGSRRVGVSMSGMGWKALGPEATMTC